MTNEEMIEARHYSIVSVRLTGPADSASFIIFEPDYTKAKQVSTAWLNHQFDDRVVEISVNTGAAQPTTTMAEICVQNNKIIPTEDIFDRHKKHGLTARPVTQADLEPGGILNPLTNRPAMYTDLTPNGKLSFEDGLFDADDDKGDIPI